MVELMEREAKKRKAPVYTLKGEIKSPFQHLVAALLSSRTRDEATASAVQRLFSKVRTPEELAELNEEEIAELIKGVGFYRVKARRLKELARKLVEDYNSEVPLKFEELVKLPGIGRKSANVVLAYSGIPAIPVDTHVHRISNRLGLVKTEKPEETEERLKEIFPVSMWDKVNKAFVGFGQTVCKPVKPLCDECPLRDECPKVEVKG
ncbi:endonuclease III domain-containing protein [Archaeoglobus sp.]